MRTTPENGTKESDDDERVGYCRPPVHSQFKPGQSGNPRGRRPIPKNATDILEHLNAQKIRVKSAGREKSVSRITGILMRLQERALAGDTRSIELVLKLDGRISRPAPFVVDVADDVEIERAIKKLVGAGQAKGSSDDESP